jgi:hypothetical protein
LITVCNEADAFGKERILDLDLLESDRALLACNFGQTGDLIHQVALAHAAQREGKLGTEGKPVKDRCERKADERCGK